MRDAEGRRQSGECRAKRTGEERIGETGDGRILVTRRGLAVALGVSLRTVERMLHDEEIEPVRLHGWSVRFHVPDVVRRLRELGATRKNGRAVNAEKLKAETLRAEIGNGKEETRYPRRVG
jgi:excisionase family DNA binding protein